MGKEKKKTKEKKFVLLFAGSGGELQREYSVMFQWCPSDGS